MRPLYIFSNIVEWIDFDYSNFAVWRILFWGTILFVVNYLTKRVVPTYIKQQEYKLTFAKYYPGVEIFLWALFIIYFIQYFLLTNQLFALGLAILFFIALFWFFQLFLKDVIAGVILRLSSKLSVGDMVHIDQFEGKILQFKSNVLCLETINGQTIFLHYNKILNQTLVQTDPSGHILTHSFILKTKSPLSVTILKQQLKEALMLLSWSCIKQIPQIHPLSQTGQIYEFRLTVFTYEQERFIEVENYIKQKFGHIQ
jgi:hypothetical protein